MRNSLRFSAVAILIALILGCISGEIDEDNDGFNNEEDCDDTDASIHPDAEEVCDGLDNNCSGTVDGADSVDALSFYTDADQDGYGDVDGLILACEQPDGTSEVNTDCDDEDDETHPDQIETCDGLDNDCDSYIDDYEPNNTINDSVVALRDNDSVTFGAWTHDGTPDWWAIYAYDNWEVGWDGFFVKARLNSVPAGTELNLRLYDPNGNLMEEILDAGPGDELYSEGSIWDDDLTGYYFVEVEVESGGTCAETYQLFLENDG